MCELIKKLRSYKPTSGYSTIMRKAADEIERLEKSLAEAEKKWREAKARAMEWKKIETAPKDGTVILAWRHYPVAIRYVCGKEWQWEGVQLGTLFPYPFFRDGFFDGDVCLTHWMPLPPAPGGTASKKEKDELEDMVGKRVYVVWTKKHNDWHWFTLLEIEGNKIMFRGEDSPEGYKHAGDKFWINRSEIAAIKLVSD